MKKILVLTDFSDHASHALSYACNLANSYNTEELIILNSYEIVPLYDMGDTASLSISMQQTEELETQRSRELDKLIVKVKNLLKHDTIVDTHLTNINLVDAVNDITLSKNIDLVVMGIKVKSEIEQVLLGSHAHRAIEKINRPVMVVPINAAITNPQRIILVTNFYEAENKPALQNLKKYLAKLKAPVVVAHKIRRKEDRAQTEKLAAQLKAELREYLPEVIIIDDEKDLGDNVNQIAQEHNASLVISLHKKRGFFSRLFHKSTSKHLAWYSRVPVLVLHFE